MADFPDKAPPEESPPAIGINVLLHLGLLLGIEPREVERDHWKIDYRTTPAFKNLSKPPNLLLTGPAPSHPAKQLLETL